MAHFNNFGCYLIEVNLDDQSLFRLVLASGISASLGLLETFRQHELHSLMHFSSHSHQRLCEMGHGQDTSLDLGESKMFLELVFLVVVISEMWQVS